VLAEAMDVAGSMTDEAAEAAARAHVHGFHTYPARMHPVTARRLVEGLSEPGETVLDPFCGSGTVLVEARLCGRRAIGVDLNPLAVRLASRKVIPSTEGHRAALVQGARDASAVADARRKARAGASHRYPAEDVEAFDPHVLLELDGLRVGIDGIKDASVRADLLLVLSSILVKVSRKPSDTAGGPTRTTRIAAGFTARTFLKKTEELARNLGEVAPELARNPRATIDEDDARELRRVDSDSIDLVVTSPPYAGVYDYLEHHRLRFRWLGLSSDRLAQGEIGARRNLSKLAASAGAAAFADQLAATLGSLARVVRAGGMGAFLVADSAMGSRAIRADELFTALAPSSGFDVVAIASQPRPNFHAGSLSAFSATPRREHIVLLQRHAKETERP
jgi:hypothetical protein